jgi:hypothetical protein
MASSVANMIPVAGQFVSAGLAIAGLFVKVFAGKKKKKAEEAAAKVKSDQNAVADKINPTPDVSGGQGLAKGGESQITTAPTTTPATPAFSSYGGGQAPSIQQQALNSATGIN